jgi:proteasome lid subunit RPN8/RPN11
VSGARLWRIWLSEEPAELIGEAARSAHPDETGGVLIGVSLGTRPWVTEAVLVPSEKSSPVYYELPAGARQEAVDRARLDDRRLGYIGEWHSHTYDIGPSDIDRETMTRLAARGEDCRRPVLLIARRRDEAHRLEAHQQVGRRLRPLRLLAAGPLPPEDDNPDDRSTDG